MYILKYICVYIYTLYMILPLYYFFLILCVKDLLWLIDRTLLQSFKTAT